MNKLWDNRDKPNMLDAVERFDGWENEVSGFGSAAKSKMENVSFGSRVFLGREQIEELYRNDWAAQKLINLPVFDMMREGIDFTEDEGAQASVDAIEDEGKRLDLNSHLWLGLVEAFKFGGSLAVVTFDDPLDWEEELNPNLVKGIKRIDIVPGGRNGFAQPVEWDRDIESPTLGDPTIYQVNRNFQSVALTQRIHASRVVRFDSPVHTSQITKVRNYGWNDSRIQGVYAALKNFGVAVESGAETLENFVFMILKSTGLAEKILNNKSNAVLTRIASLVNRITAGRVAMIGEGEELTKVGTPITGLDELMVRYEEYVCAASNIPRSRFIGNQSGTLGANAMDGDIANYFDWAKSLQENLLRPPIEKFHEFFSYYLNFDHTKVDFQFSPLWQLTEGEQADLYLKTAQGDQIYELLQVVTPEEVAMSRFSGKKFDSTSMHIDFKDKSRQEAMLNASPDEADELINGNGEPKQKEEE